MREPTTEEINGAIDVLESAGTVVSLGFWTKGALARNSAGRCVLPLDPAACTWCAAGALQAASHALCSSWAADRIAAGVLRRHVLSRFNDAQSSPEPVAKLFFDAADELRGRLSSG